MFVYWGDKMTKHREFWIDHDQWYSKEEKEFNDRTCSSVLWDTSGLVHVIEIAALTELVEENKRLKDHLSLEKKISDSLSDDIDKLLLAGRGLVEALHMNAANIHYPAMCAEALEKHAAAFRETE